MLAVSLVEIDDMAHDARTIGRGATTPKLSNDLCRRNG
jgi:hypothetical protein